MPPKVPPNPFNVYRHGISFLLVDNQLRKQAKDDPNVKPWVAVPGMVISAFASEVFLKGTSNNTPFYRLGRRVIFGSIWGEGRAGPF